MAVREHRIFHDEWDVTYVLCVWSFSCCYRYRCPTRNARRVNHVVKARPRKNTIPGLGLSFRIGSDFGSPKKVPPAKMASMAWTRWRTACDFRTYPCAPASTNFGSQPLEIMGRKYQHRCREPQLSHSGARLQSAHSWHRYVQDDEVWLQLSGKLDRLLAICTFSTDIPIGARLSQMGSKPLAYNFMIVNN